MRYRILQFAIWFAAFHACSGMAALNFYAHGFGTHNISGIAWCGGAIWCVLCYRRERIISELTQQEDDR